MCVGVLQWDFASVISYFKKRQFCTFVSDSFLDDRESDGRAKALIFKFTKNLPTNSQFQNQQFLFWHLVVSKCFCAIELNSSLSVSVAKVISNFVNENRVNAQIIWFHPNEMTVLPELKSHLLKVRKTLKQNFSPFFFFFVILVSSTEIVDL